MGKGTAMVSSSQSTAVVSSMYDNLCSNSVGLGCVAHSTACMEWCLMRGLWQHWSTRPYACLAASTLRGRESAVTAHYMHADILALPLAEAIAAVQTAATLCHAILSGCDMHPGCKPQGSARLAPPT